MSSLMMMLAAAGVDSAFEFTRTISVDTTNYNLRAAAIAAGWDQSSPLIAHITLASGIVISANSTSVYAFDTGAGFPAGSTLAFVNSGGYVIGMGGAGGVGSAINGYNRLGQPGGDAFRAQAPIVVTNNGTIGGGGGGGGGGGAGGGGGRSGRTNSAGGQGGNTFTDGFPGTFSAGGAGKLVSDLTSGTGGSWGGAGTAGYADGYPVQYGGAGGRAVVGTSFITWAATGTRLGAIT